MLWARSIHLEDRKRRLAYLVERAAIGRLLHSETFEEGDKLLESTAPADRRRGSR